MRRVILLCLFLLMSSSAFAQELTAKFIRLDDAFFEKPDPMASQWNDIAEVQVPLFPQNIAQPSIYQTSVVSLVAKAIYNKHHLAVLLVWDDPMQNANVSHDYFTDACAIQFPIKKVELTSPFMGNKEAPVMIMHWKAIWQKDIDEHYQKVADLYPNTWIDSDRFGKTIAIDAKNPVSQSQRSTPVEELMAEGFGTLTSQERQDASGRGVWKDGKWFVVLTRPLKSGDAHDPALRIGKPTAISFAVWEGEHRNVGARKNYAPWVPFVLESK